MTYLLITFLGLIFGFIIVILTYPKSERKWRLNFQFLAGLKNLLNIAMVVGTAVLLNLLYFFYKLSGQFISYALIMLVLEISMITDIREKVIYDRMVITGVILGALAYFINPEMSWLSALLGIVIVGGILWLLSFISKGGLGMGDVKLFACCGLFLGIEKNLSALITAIILCGITGLVLIIKNPANKKKELPFAPFVFLGVMFSMFF